MSDWKKAAIQTIRKISDELEADIHSLVNIIFTTTMGDDPQIITIEIHKKLKQKIELPPEVEYENIL